MVVDQDRVFISIYESNSDDGTGIYLAEYRESLDELGIPNQVVPMVKDEGDTWPYGTSPQRIEFLARLRNKAMEPIQSADPDHRLENWREFTKVIFLNDIRFEWEDIVRLIATRAEGKENEDYDVACAMDFGEYGEY
jgi:alpha-1,3-mannosyltransferase